MENTNDNISILRATVDKQKNTIESMGNSNNLLRTIVERQRGIMDEQSRRMSGYLSVIDFISTLARSKNIVIPLDKITDLLDAKTNDDRDRLLVQFKMEIVQDVLNEFEKTVETFGSYQEEPPVFNDADSWNSPEWDDGVYAPPPEEVNTDITKWKVFDRKWRMFGNG
jgi:hypothetical protein